MDLAQYHIIKKLRQEILPLEGLKVLPSDTRIDLGIQSMMESFPGHRFPVGCIHDLVYHSREHMGAAYGFLSFILGKLMHKQGCCAWISNRQNVFPGALKVMGIQPENVIFIRLSKPEDILFTFEEALKCESLSAVVGEMQYLDFKYSRRLQLAAEKSRVTGFLLRENIKSISSIASIARWRISCLPSNMEYGMPGVGYPRWQIALEKIRNGIPNQWDVEWRPGALWEIQSLALSISQQYTRKTG